MIYTLYGVCMCGMCIIHTLVLSIITTVNLYKVRGKRVFNMLNVANQYFNPPQDFELSQGVAGLTNGN
jgi:hypothetical protein